MRNHSIAFAFIMGVLASAFLETPVLAKGLYHEFKNKTLKTFVETRESFEDKQNEVSPQLLKTQLESTLVDRKSTKFIIVNDKSQADIVVDVDILGFYWTDQDPVDMIVGVGAVAMDAATKEDYASMEANFKIIDKRGFVIWKEKLKGTITKKSMPRAESMTLVSQELVKSFTKECLSKSKSK